MTLSNKPNSNRRRVVCDPRRFTHLGDALKSALASKEVATPTAESDERGPRSPEVSTQPSTLVASKIVYCHCLHCNHLPHPDGPCKALDAAGDECDCERSTLIADNTPYVSPQREARPPQELAMRAAGYSGDGPSFEPFASTNAHIQMAQADEDRLRIAGFKAVGQVHDEVIMETLQQNRRINDLSSDERKLLEQDLRSGHYTSTQLTEVYRLSGVHIVEALKARLGLTKRREQIAHPAVDLDDEIEQAEKKIAELKAKKAEQMVRFEWIENSASFMTRGPDQSACDGVVLIHGVGARFRAAGGFAKFRAWVEKEISQVGAPPANPLEPSQLERDIIKDSLNLINEHLNGHYVDLDDALRNLLQAYVTMRDNAQEAQTKCVWIVERKSGVQDVEAVFGSEQLAHEYVLKQKFGDYRILTWIVRDSTSI